nr:rhomboid family intramembrane serine protease [uncultured Lacibacter sp.]
MNYMQAERKKKIGFGEDGDALMRLIFINIMVFVILGFIKIVYQLSDSNLTAFNAQIMNWIGLPGSFSSFAVKPWTLLLHMISHDTVWRLLGNMICFWAFGYLLQDLLGNRHIVPIYIYGALAGALLFIASVSLLPAFSKQAGEFVFYGAGASVMAVAIAVTVIAHDYRVFPMINGGIPLWIITLIYVLINFAGLAGKGFPFHLSHLGGGAMGFVYVKLIQNGNSPGEWMHNLYNWFINLFNPASKPPKKTIKKEVFYNTKGQQPFSRKPNITEQRVDAILDKISRSGYQSLSEEEKEILKNAADSET